MTRTIVLILASVLLVSCEQTLKEDVVAICRKQIKADEECISTCARNYPSLADGLRPCGTSIRRRCTPDCLKSKETFSCCQKAMAAEHTPQDVVDHCRRVEGVDKL